MALPDQLADLERKVSARFTAALTEIRDEMRRAVEAQTQRAGSALLKDLEAIRPQSAERLFAEEDLLESTRAAENEARRTLGRSLRRALVEFDQARTQSAVLEALLGAARPFGDRAALWLMRPSVVLGWAGRGFGDSAGDPIAGATVSHASSAALSRLASGRAGVRLQAAEAGELAAALGATAPARALLLPLVLRDRIAAALYVDAASAGEFEIEALQLLTLAAAQRLELQALASRSYTPTLFLESEAPANLGGLALWDPAGSATAAPANAPTSSWAVADPSGAHDEADDTFAAAPSAPRAPEIATPAVAPLAPTPPLPDLGGVDEFVVVDEPTHAEAMPSVGVAAAQVPLPDVAGGEISWQMEADETLLLGSTPAAPEAAAAVEAETAPWSTPRPTHEIPLATSAASEWQEVEETTAPHSTVSATTQRFVAPGTTNEFPQPTLSPAPESAPSPAAFAGAATVAFVPPAAALAGEMVEDATVRIQRSALTSPPPPTPTAFAGAIEPPAEPARAAAPAAGLPDDEPTINRGGKTTEVAPPADLQGPGWAFSSVRSPRSTGDNALHEEARRLARLLVSEIKLYNEDQVEEGRHNRDIYHRLKDDIDRSRQIYEERVHESVRGTTDYFQQELIRSLAGGDPRALGI